MNALAFNIEELESLEAPGFWGAVASVGLGVATGFVIVGIGIWVT